MSGTALGQVIVFVSLLLLTKLFTPEDFGLLGTYQSVVSTIWVVATLRYDLAISVTTDFRERILVAFGAISSSITFCILLTIFLISVTYIIPIKDEKIRILLSHYCAIPLGVLVVSISSILELFLVSENNFSLVSISKFTQAFSMSLTQLILGYVHSDSISLVAGYIAGYLFSAIILLAGTKNYVVRIKEVLREDNIISNTIEIMTKLKKFPLYSMPSSFANIGSFYLPVFLISFTFSPEKAGFFFLAIRVIGLPIDTLTNAISQVFLGNSPEMLSNNPSGVLNLFIKVTKLMAAIGIIPLGVLYFKADSILAFIFGVNWSYTGTLVSLLTIMYMARIIATPLSHTLNVLKKLEVQLIWDVSRLAVITLLFLLTWRLKFSIEVFVLMFSILMALLYVVHACLSFYFLKKFVEESEFRNA